MDLRPTKSDETRPWTVFEPDLEILHQRIRYEERGPAVSIEAKQARPRKMIRELRSLGYRVERLAESGSPA